MVDPLTAYGVAVNILQCIELGSKLVQKTIEYSATGGSHEHDTLRSLAQQLIVSNAHLQTSLQTNGPRKPTPGPARALYLANEECLKVSKEFISLIEELKLNGHVTPWKSVRLALKSLKCRPRIYAMKDQLSHVRANLMLSLIVFMATKNFGNSVSMVLPTPQNDGTTENTTAEATMRKEVRHAALSDKTFKDDLEKLIYIVSDDNEDEYGAFKAIESVCHSHRKELEKRSKRLEDTLAAQNQDLGQLLSKMDSLLRAMNTETLYPRKVLDSLYYVQMDDRHNRVSRAHSQTFQWIFRHKSDNDLLWDDFLEWLSSPHKHNIYWVRGKAGSGKSTLMRELDEKVSEQESLADLFQEAEFLKASSYLWNAGSVVQKSLSGLLLSLVYQLFQQRADLIDSTVPSSRWQSDLLQEAQIIKWTEAELQEALKSFTSKACPEAKVLLLVDGLDEYDGTDEQRMDMISLFKELTAIDGVKVCVSSRPWVIYKDAFKSCPQLCLEELTKGDISTYVHDQLLGNELFRAQQRRHPKLLTYLSDEIIQKANGVFLWVRLVVRELLKRVRDGGWASELIDQLHEIPPDLDEYFTRMMESIEPRYR